MTAGGGGGGGVGTYELIARHTIVSGYYDLTLDVCVSVCPSLVRPSMRLYFVSG